MKNKNTTRCLFPNCNRPVKCRGLCNSHYIGTFHLIRAKRVPKWEILEKHGRVLPAAYRTNSGLLEAYLNGKL